MKEDKKLNSIFRTYPEIKLVYLFGSMATGSEGPLSDYDFAIYLDTKDKTRIYEIKADMIVRIGKLLKTDSIDVVILNLTDNPVLRYMIIKEGRLIYEKEPFKVILEPIILNEYFDFQKMLTKHNLTKAPVWAV
ncbi:MAG: type VII toxin-antitoxin system MntA family adenylyltransferase antitoxin [Candidatus Jordarchaeum sp.]|uniref:type VII toxin-antitoxin system MntA family adenylyltransferase antitoxin n=1 Tax=Candidatus Jordarchaeum sp. TaxID=2823881 RepID=UPI00404A5662